MENYNSIKNENINQLGHIYINNNDNKNKDSLRNALSNITENNTENKTEIVTEYVMDNRTENTTVKENKNNSIKSYDDTSTNTDVNGNENVKPSNDTNTSIDIKVNENENIESLAETNSSTFVNENENIKPSDDIDTNTFINENENENIKPSDNSNPRTAVNEIIKSSDDTNPSIIIDENEIIKPLDDIDTSTFINENENIKLSDDTNTKTTVNEIIESSDDTNTRTTVNEIIESSDNTNPSIIIDENEIIKSSDDIDTNTVVNENENINPSDDTNISRVVNIENDNIKSSDDINTRTAANEITRLSDNTNSNIIKNENEIIKPLDDINSSITVDEIENIKSSSDINTRTTVNEIIESSNDTYLSIIENENEIINPLENTKIKVVENDIKEKNIPESQINNVNQLDTKNNDNLQNTTVYTIISCSNEFSLNDCNIEIINKSNSIQIIKDQLIEIVSKNDQCQSSSTENDDNKLIVKELNNILNEKKFYLYKADVNLKNDKEKFEIQITSNNDKIITKSSYGIEKYQQLFIYNQEFNLYNKMGQILTKLKTIKKYFDNKPNIIYDIINKKNEISDLQKLLIYKNYLTKNNMDLLFPYLLEEGSETVTDPRKPIDFYYILTYMSILINQERDFNNIPDNLKTLLEYIILNLLDNKDILFTKDYDIREYSETIQIIEKYNNFSFDNMDRTITGLYLFTLIYYQFTDHKDKFKEIFEKIPLKQEAVEFIKNHNNIFPNLKCLNLKLIFDIADKESTSFNDVLLLSSNYNEYLNFFCLFEDFILNDNPNIKFGYGPEPNENTEINLLVPYFNILSRMNLNKKDYSFIKKKFINFIDKIMNVQDFEKLKELERIFNDIPNDFQIKEDLSKKTNYALHCTGKVAIENGQLNNLEIIHFIQNDIKKYSKDYKHKPEYTSLIRYVDLNKIDDEFCNIFIGDVDYEKIIKEKYDVFLNSIMNKAETFKHLQSLIKIFNYDNKPKPSEKVIEKLLEIFTNNSLEKEDMTITELQMIINKLIKLISDSTNSNTLINTFMNAMKKNFGMQEINDILVFTLNSSNKLSRVIIGKLVENITNLSHNRIVEIMDKLEGKEIIMKFIENLRNKEVKEEDIFSIKYSENLKLLKELIKRGYFKYNDQKFKRISYVKKTYDIINSQIRKLKDFNYSMNQIRSMFQLYKENNDENENNLQERFFILSFGDDKHNNIKSIYEKTVEKIMECMDLYEKIDEIISVFQYYYPNDKKVSIERYENIRNNISKEPICKFPTREELYDFDRLYKEAHHISNLKDSKFFIEIYQQVKQSHNEYSTITDSKDKELMEETIENFNNLKYLFDEITENKVNIINLEGTLSSINEIKKEIKLLIKVFEITQPRQSLNKVEQKLKLLKNRKNNINKYNRIILLLQDFKSTQDDNIQIKLNEIIEHLKKDDELTLKNLISLNEELKKLNLDILNTNSKENRDALALIEKMYEKSELIDFIKNKTIIDIHPMGEFIDDAEDVYLTLADIDQLETCVAFIHDLKNKGNELDERTFLNTFINTLSLDPNYKDIYNKFENSSSKINDFNELYTIHLNPNELNKVHIKKIYSSSEFIIKYCDPDYQCQVKYYNNKGIVHKNLDELLELREVALLRKKDQREKNYFQICDDFANMINDILTILNMLGIISSKGYFEDIEYKISISDGNAIGYKINSEFDSEEVCSGKTLKEIIDELNGIRKLQDEIVKSIYLKNQNIRMIHGRQFNYIYKYMKYQKDENDTPKNLKTLIKKYYYILLYITRYKFIYETENLSINNIEGTTLSQMLTDVGEYINSLYEISNINLNRIYNDANILENIEKRGIYSYICQYEDIEQNAIRCSLCLTGEFPLAQTVLYCNKETSNEELMSFIYKCILCEQNVLFILIKPENLSIEKKKLLIELLKDLYASKPKKMISCLLFIYAENSRTTEIITEIEKLPHHKFFDFKKKEYENEDEDKEDNDTNEKIDVTNMTDYKIFSEVEVYSSDYSGLGKSTLIKNSFKEDYPDHEYIYFQLADNIDKKEIIERLLNFPIDKKIALHLDLYDSKQIESLSEFLFSFLFLKYYSQNENIFYYGNKMKIKVEIQNSFIDFKQIFPFLNFFKKIHITQKTMPPLIVPKDIKSNIQIVCFYLKNLDHIDEREIFINGIDGIEETLYSIKFIEPLNSYECWDLLFKYLNIEKPNYYQIVSYVNILAEQLILFSKSYYLNISQLEEYKKYLENLESIRKFFIQSLTQITSHFITSSYDNIIKGQKNAHDFQKKKIDIEKAIKEAVSNMTKKQVFSIKNIKPSMLLINEDGQSLSIIVTCKKKSKEYERLKALYTLDPTTKDIINYHNMQTRDFLIEVKKVLNIKNPIDEDDATKDKTLPLLKDIVKSYVFTADNFIKLILISLRLRTNVPVILMGETGCGKTSLIRIIAKLKDIPLLIKNIHAGVEDKDIIQFISDNNLFEKTEYNKNKTERNETLVWVFLDEINTCNSLGLISEIMTKHSCKGCKIRDNVKFIAACNPYRLNTSEPEIVGLYDEKKYIVRKLVYNVNPLPHSLLNFIFDFGAPESSDIKLYISNMVNEMLVSQISNNYILNKIKTIAEKSIFDAHQYIKNNFDISSVSLREIRRLEILFDWFSNILLRNPYVLKEIKLADEKRYLYALNLSIYLCYYIRIFNKEKRKEFLKEMRHSFGAQFKFEDFPKQIQNIIATAVELEKGIARNKALLENLFAIFVCLNTKIPLFIIGKPGCSKSLSAQLIFKSMNGKDSSHEFFKHFPKVYTRSYQGSTTSTSEGILKLFKMARDSLKDENLSKNIISAIYFDEMGLAELSESNPLKVIHSQLEYDDNELKIAFIGISNWPFDASKMNRGIYHSIPEPDEDDLTETGYSIAESYDPRLIQNYKSHMKFLSLTYFKYKELLKENPLKFVAVDNSHLKFQYSSNLREFHGTRDFYHLIKIASKKFMECNFPKNPFEIEYILNESIERNFGGLDHSIEIFKNILKKFMPISQKTSEYNVMKCITDNIKDANSRYLLIETKNSVSQFLITLILNKLNKKYEFYYGSNFKEDTNHGYYTAKVLNKVQVTMDENCVIILKNLTSMYPSLYDLFNQNFRRVGDSNYARIALGNSNTQNYRVHDQFRCIVLLDRNEIEKQDPPFINRFEKHHLDFEKILSEKQIKLSQEIYTNLQNLIHQKGENGSFLEFPSEIVNCDLEEIQGIICQILLNHANVKEKEHTSNLSSDNDENDRNHDNGQGNENRDDDKYLKKDKLILRFDDFENDQLIKQDVYEKLVPTFSQDVIFYYKYSEYGKQHKEEFDNISNIYFKKEHQHQNLRSYLETINTKKHIIYTYSNILDEIEAIENYKYGSFNKKSIKNILVNKSNSERYIDDKISEYFNDKNLNLCIFHFDQEVYINMNHINYLIENNENRLNDAFEHEKQKPIVFIIHLKRIIDANKRKEFNISEYFISHLTEWKQIFIDNLNGKNINLKKVLNASNHELFRNYDLFNLESEFDNHLYNAFSCIKYNINVNMTDIENNEYIKKACEYIMSNKQLKKTIQNLVLKKIEMNKESIIQKIFTHYNFEENDVDFITIIIKNMKTLYNDALKSTLIQFEQNHIISTKMFSELNNNYIESIYQTMINSFDSTLKKYSVFSRKKINLLLGISFPNIIPYFEEIHKYIVYNNLKKDYLEIENSIYTKKEIMKKEKRMIEDKLIKEFEKYSFSKLFRNENDNEDYEKAIENLNQNQLIQILFKDYIIYYLSKSNIKFSNKRIIDFYIILYELFIFINNNSIKIISIDDDDDSSDDDETYENHYMSEEEDDDDYDNMTHEKLIKFILFIESYHHYIINLSHYINILDMYTEDFISNYTKILSDKKFLFKRKGMPRINALFNNLYESAVFCTLNMGQIYEISNENLENLLGEIKTFSDTLIKESHSLGLSLKQALYLNDLIDVKEAFSKNGIPLKENLKEYLKYLNTENKRYLLPEILSKETLDNCFDNDDDFDNNSSSEGISEEFDFLKFQLNNDYAYSQLMIKLINNKMNISQDEKYRLQLLKILCSNNIAVNGSKIIFETLFKDFNLCPEDKTIRDDEDNNRIFNVEYVDEYEEESSEDEEDDENVIYDNEDENDDYDDEDNGDDESEEENDSKNEESSDDEYDNDDDDDGTGVRFLNELERESCNPLIEFLNNNDNKGVDEVLLTLFDGKFLTYFKSKASDEDRILDQSLQIFKNSVNYIEDNNCEMTHGHKLGILYCISYIKFYCFYLSKVIYDRRENDDDDELLEEDISTFLNGSNEFRKIIKIYILKLLNKLLFKNYKDLLHFVEKKKLFTNDFDFNEKVPCALNYLFIQNDTIETYKNLRTIYSSNKIEKFKSTEEISKSINKTNFLIFYDLIINEEISNLSNTKKINEYFYSYLTSILLDICLSEQPIISDLSDKIISIYFNDNSVKKQLSELNKLSSTNFEILLYAHKFALISSFSKPNTVYSNLLSPSLMQNLQTMYIPGGEPKSNLMIESTEEIQKYFKKGGEEEVYMCSCGNWYTLNKCGRPWDLGTCNICNKTIGGKNHVLQSEGKGHVSALEPVHVRVCKDEAHRLKYSEPIPYKFIDELKTETEKLSQNPIQGYKKVSKRIFLKKTKKVRNMNNVTYRILSFIFFSCIYYSEKLEFIKLKDLQNFYYEDASKREGNESILSILKDIWSILETELGERRIDNIQIFLNSIMPEITDLISKNEFSLIHSKDREYFENQCNQVVEKAIVNYSNYYRMYMKNNQGILEINDDTIKAILQETSNIENLPQSSYPLIQYFYVATYPNYIEFEEQFDELEDSLKHYPVLTNYLKATSIKKEEIEFLKNFCRINPLITYALEKYSNEISRAQAKETLIKDELEKGDDHMKKLFKKFKKGWEKVYDKLSNYDCQGKLPEKNITEDDCLAYILNDNHENGFGKYIATFYKDIITYQEMLLKPMIERKAFNDYLYPYAQQIENKMVVQKAGKQELMTFEIDNGLFSSFQDLVYAFSYRDCITQQGQLNYTNYKKIKYDFNGIELILTKILLPGKRLFKNEYEQKFISYCQERFEGNHNIISDFYEKIMQNGQKGTAFSKEEKKSIEDKNKKWDYKFILNNLQSLFLFFTNEKSIQGNEILQEKLDHIPNKIVNEDFKQNLRNLPFNIKLNQLIDFYDIMEELNFNKILKDVSIEAKNDLKKPQIEKLKKHFNQENLLISKKDLAHCIRKIISRYLVNDICQIYPWNIFDFIDKPELWNENLLTQENKGKFDEEIQQLQELKIIIGQSVPFYKILTNEKPDKMNTTTTTTTIKANSSTKKSNKNSEKLKKSKNKTDKKVNKESKTKKGTKKSKKI